VPAIGPSFTSVLDGSVESPLGDRAGLTFSDRGARIVAFITLGRLGGRADSRDGGFRPMANETVDVVAGGIRTAPVTDGARLRLANHFAHLLAETDGFDRQEFLKACSPFGTDFSNGGERDGKGIGGGSRSSSARSSHYEEAAEFC
jgi:hypothetical protein